MKQRKRISPISIGLLCSLLHCAILSSAQDIGSQIPNATPEITVKEYIVFDGLEGWQHEGVMYRLACAAMVAQAPSGDLLCWWLSGSDKEPSTDNCILMARSKDRGHTWSEPRVMIPAGEMAGALTIMYTGPKKQLIGLGAHWPPEKLYTEWHWFRIESTDSGYTWTEPEPFVLHGDHASVCQGPVRLRNGELLLPGQFFDERPKPFVAPVEQLVHAKTEEEAQAMPPGPGTPAVEYATHLNGCCVFIDRVGDARNFEEYGYVANRPLGLLEPTCIQLKDGRIVMLMRAEWGGFLWRADSSDNGRTWTKAWQTDIPNPTSLTHLVRLPDERIALIHNATGGIVGKRAHRDPLSIWISDDEMESWAIKADVIHGGELAYPNGMILEDRLVFTYDRDRRQARFVEVEIPRW
ncbi:MAG TPA: sialidase family protein, partial [bacterium]|nr:sialidase family protein [bacterium]